MDHLDGIKDLFASFPIINIWDTDNKKEIVDFQGGGYNKEDWEFYKRIRSGDTDEKTRLTNFAGELRDFWKDDHIRILAPTRELLKAANDCDDYNDSSYVLLFTPPKKGGGVWKILFAGDSHDKTWEYILGDDTFCELVKNVDVLFAPHHGRDSDRSFNFLETIQPKLTLFGNASSKHLAYDKYPKVRITNNQAGYVVLNVQFDRIDILVKNKEFAQNFRNNHGRNWGDTTHDPILDAFYLGALMAK
jgi:beta-lactamase superfamily II metal-dependent hydrolase